MFITEALAQGAGGESGFLIQFAPLVLIGTIIYFLLIRPAKKRKNLQEERLSSQEERLSSIERRLNAIESPGYLDKLKNINGVSNNLAHDIIVVFPSEDNLRNASAEEISDAVNGVGLKTANIIKSFY